MRYAIELAGPEDDAELRRRMAEDRMRGYISLSFRREPSYFLGCRVQGEGSRVIKCTDSRSGKIVGLGARHGQRLFLNGEETIVGYLSDLRADIDVRRRTLLARGYAFLRKLHDAEPLPLYYSVILQGNDEAVRALSGARAGLPIYEARGRILTPAIHLDRRLAELDCAGVSIRQANAEIMPDVFGFLRRELARKQLAPAYRESDLGSGRLLGLSPIDFYVATQGKTIVGCVAAWDQSAFRQTHVEEYSASLRAARPFYNLAARFTSVHELPPVGGQIRFLYLGMIAVTNDSREVFASLLRSIYRDRRAGENHFMIAGLHEDDPLCPVLHDYRRIDAGGTLFLIYYPEQRDTISAIDKRVPYIEMAAV